MKTKKLAANRIYVAHDATPCNFHPFFSLFFCPSGPGFNGGGIGQELKFMITACDSDGNRLRQGGAEVMVIFTAPRGGDVVTMADVKDNGDGTYQVTYKAPETRGFYDLNIEVSTLNSFLTFSPDI